MLLYIFCSLQGPLLLMNGLSGLSGFAGTKREECEHHGYPGEYEYCPPVSGLWHLNLSSCAGVGGSMETLERATRWEPTGNLRRQGRGGNPRIAC